MEKVLCLIIWLALAVSMLGADRSLEHARAAQSLLGPETWSRVIRVENESRSSRYARTLHALVFEFGGILWFYTDTDGTQSFSLHRGRLAEEKADFGLLLHDIEPGFTHWRVVTEESTVSRHHVGGLPNDCFITSVAALRERIERGANAAEAKLLSYYVTTPAGVRGHTVLTFVSSEGVAVVDAQESPVPRIFPHASVVDPLALAGAYSGASVVKARWIPAGPEIPAAGMTVAGGGSSDEGAQATRRMLAVR